MEIKFFSVKDIHCPWVLTYLSSPIEWQTFCQNSWTCYYFLLKKTEFPFLVFSYFRVMPSSTAQIMEEIAIFCIWTHHAPCVGEALELKQEVALKSLINLFANSSSWIGFITNRELGVRFRTDQCEKGVSHKERTYCCRMRFSSMIVVNYFHFYCSQRKNT